MPPSEIHVKSFKSEEVDTQERERERERMVFVFPCRTGGILQEAQPLSTAVCEAGGDFGYLWSIMGEIIFRNHVASTTKFYVPKNDFPMLLYYSDVQRDKNKP